jgi:hypothetical protein
VHQIIRQSRETSDLANAQLLKVEYRTSEASTAKRDASTPVDLIGLVVKSPDRKCEIITDYKREKSHTTLFYLMSPNDDEAKEPVNLHTQRQGYQLSVQKIQAMIAKPAVSKSVWTRLRTAATATTPLDTSLRQYIAAFTAEQVSYNPKELLQDLEYENFDKIERAATRDPPANCDAYAALSKIDYDTYHYKADVVDHLLRWPEASDNNVRTMQ